MSWRHPEVRLQPVTVTSSSCDIIRDLLQAVLVPVEQQQEPSVLPGSQPGIGRLSICVLIGSWVRPEFQVTAGPHSGLCEELPVSEERRSRGRVSRL